jgi:hypothetical protein
MATDPGTDPGVPQQEVTVEGGTVDGTNNSLTQTSTVVQYPKPPRRDDGKWMAISSMIGSILGMIASTDIIDKAKDAEDKWTDLTNFFADQGKEISTWADTLKDCDNVLHDKLCQFAQCGYQADYEGVMRRARQSAHLAAENAYAQACRTADRYHTGVNCDVWASIKRAEIAATVQATVMAYEAERQIAFDKNFEILERTTQLFENDYMNRKRLAYDALAGAGQNYGYLAQSLRQTAKADMGDIQLLASALGVALPIIFSYGCSSETYCDGTDQPQPTPTP